MPLLVVSSGAQQRRARTVADGDVHGEAESRPYPASA